jgi:hypothetical protein
MVFYIIIKLYILTYKVIKASINNYLLEKRLIYTYTYSKFTLKLLIKAITMYYKGKAYYNTLTLFLLIYRLFN